MSKRKREEGDTGDNEDDDDDEEEIVLENDPWDTEEDIQEAIAYEHKQQYDHDLAWKNMGAKLQKDAIKELEDRGSTNRYKAQVLSRVYDESKLEQLAKDSDKRTERLLTQTYQNENEPLIKDLWNIVGEYAKSGSYEFRPFHEARLHDERLDDYEFSSGFNNWHPSGFPYLKIDSKDRYKSHYADRRHQVAETLDEITGNFPGPIADIIRDYDSSEATTAAYNPNHFHPISTIQPDEENVTLPL